MHQALNWMGDKKPIELYGASYNQKAIKFYEKHGFRLTDDQIPAKKLKNGKIIPSMRMIRHLRP